MSKWIDTDRFSEQLRARAVNPAKRQLLISNLNGTEQANDLTEPPNCGGFGRIRHFRRMSSPGWPENPLPIDPACRQLGIPSPDMMRTQVFQNAVCNWRCWYCFVPYNLISGSLERSAWLGPKNLLELYLHEENPPLVIDLSGGQPELVPEWVPWMMEELVDRGLEKSIYLWSDDNLSNDYFWRFLSDIEIERVSQFPNYGRVCCFKGFDAESFSFNTQTHPNLFLRQFELMHRLLTTDIDLYAYATFTCDSSDNIAYKMAHFVDCLQQLDENLPLRTVPLEIQVFTPVSERLNPSREASLIHQQLAIEAWNQELEKRFGTAYKSLNIADVRLGTVNG